MIAELTTLAKSQDLPLLRLETGEKLAAAIKLYEKHGFTITARGFEEFRQLEDIRYEWTRE